jgi:membrane protein YdbS with pleckstrin-like domain
MQDRVVRPSMKTIRASYVLALIVIGAAVYGYFAYYSDKPIWLLAIPLVVLLAPLRAQVRRNLVKLTFHGDHLTYDVGLLSKSSRTLDLTRVQDVTVRQTLGQRMLGVGSLTLETAGESSRLTVNNLDRPLELRDYILRAAQGNAQGRSSGM